jgi:hypothetical protein
VSRNNGPILNSRLIPLFCIISLVSLSAPVPATPRILWTAPAYRAQNVSPDITEIRVGFDQPMQRGYSFTGGGPGFPESAGKAKWADSRTVVLPVRLKPLWSYRVGFNSKSHQNFRSKAGIPLVPCELIFTTGKSPVTPPDRPPHSTQSPANVHEQSAYELSQALKTRYSYRDRVVRNWDQILWQYHAPLTASKSPDEFAGIAAKLLENARDIHISIACGNFTLGTFRRNVQPNYEIKTISRTVQNWTQHNSTVASGMLDGNVRYLLIGSWSKSKKKELVAAHQVLSTMNPFAPIIIDVRPNSGGSETLARQIAGYFVDRPVVYARHRTVTGDGGLAGVSDRVLQPNAGRRHLLQGKTAVLTGARNMSSCEAFILMMRQVRNCTLVGSRTYGSSGNPKPVSLSNGVTVNLPSWQSMDAAGRPTEGVGIKPNIEVPYKSDAEGDPVIQAALAAVK